MKNVKVVCKFAVFLVQFFFFLWTDCLAGLCEILFPELAWCCERRPLGGDAGRVRLWFSGLVVLSAERSCLKKLLNWCGLSTGGCTVRQLEDTWYHTHTHTEETDIKPDEWSFKVTAKSAALNWFKHIDVLPGPLLPLLIHELKASLIQRRMKMSALRLLLSPPGATLAVQMCSSRTAEPQIRRRKWDPCWRNLPLLFTWEFFIYFFASALA